MLTTVAWVQIVYTDVSGISGTATQVTRIPPTQEPDDIAADWQQGVSDGAMLEMRVVGSAVLENLITQNPSAFSIAFGYTPQSSGAFTSLPTDASQGTYYVVGDPNFVPNATFILHSMGIENVGEVYANSVHYVLAAESYMPPCEFDPTNSLVAISSRKLSLAISLAGKVSVTGSKPNAITLTRPPVVLVNGINCNPAPNAGPRAYWGGDGGNSMLTALSNAGYNYFLADNSGADTTNATLEASGDTWGCGELTDMWTVVSAEITVAEGDYNQGYIPAGQGQTASTALEIGSVISCSPRSVAGTSASPYRRLISSPTATAGCWLVRRAGDRSRQHSGRQPVRQPRGRSEPNRVGHAKPGKPIGEHGGRGLQRHIEPHRPSSR